VKYETGFIEAHPLAMMWIEVRRVWRTWMFARSQGVPCTFWYGVYREGTEIVIANCGPLPGAKECAEKITALQNSTS
jgi:hypothetical protein